jgi:AAA15 family ATPase/GTPase
VDIKREVSEYESRGRMLRRPRILLQHQAGDEGSWLDLNEESEGTKTLFRMAPSVFRALESGGLLLVDELESSLHPLIGLAIVKLFNCPRANSRNAQVIFTTHDTNLLGTTLGQQPLRRDQVWFTEKDDEGASTLYPLTDYKPRKAENLERGYLQGRYGAIPFLGDISWMAE